MIESSRHNQKWDEAEEEAIISRFKKDVPIQRIAELHGRTEVAIECRLEKLGFIHREAATGFSTYKIIKIPRAIFSRLQQVLLLNQGA